MRLYKVFSIAIILVFLAFAIVFNTFPRSEYSELEKRELATFPHFSFKRLMSGAFTSDISTWFSDSEPYRDVFMYLSMEFDNLIRLTVSDDNITFHGPANVAQDIEEEAETSSDSIPTDDTQEEYVNNVTADENAKIANAGIMIVGTGENVRALMAYGGSAKMGGAYANTANKYKETFGDKVNVYAMVIPTAMEFYCPTKAKGHTKPQRPTIDNIHSLLSPSVKAVDAYSELAKHADEDIYLRTDHHWAPLGAYYAALKFAEVAGVPFKDLETYERRVVKRYVGSMYGYSKDVAVKNAPEDFVFYIPQGVEYSTTYINYNVNKDYQVTGESKPYKGTYFFSYKDGSGSAYCTFMGGDMKLTKVQTSVGNGRRVLIIKDSFGNAIPGYLFHSFEEVHVVDFRYFTKNMQAYVNDNAITDILFAYNVFNVCSTTPSRKAERYLTQKAGEYAVATPKNDTASDSTITDTLTLEENVPASIPTTATVSADTTTTTSTAVTEEVNDSIEHF